MTPAVASVLGAALSGVVAIIVSVINSRAQHRTLMGELERQNALQEYRLKKLEEKVDQHNHLDRRIVALEEQVKTLFEETRRGQHG